MAKKYDEVLTSLEKQQEELNLKLARMIGNHHPDEMKKCKKLIERFMKFDMPSHELMYQLIDKIEIDKDKNIEVFFKIDIGKYIEMNTESMI